MISELMTSPDWVNWSDPVNRGHSLNRGLLAWWLAVPNRAGWGSFTWRDLVRRYAGTLTNMAPATDWVGSKGRPGGWGALDLGTLDDAIEISASGNGYLGGLTQFSLHAAFYITDDTTDSDIFARGSHGGGQPFVIWHDQAATDKYQFIVTDAGGATTGVLSSSTTAVGGKWIDLLFTFKGDSQSRLYINGVEDGSSPWSHATVSDVSNTSTTETIGNDVARNAKGLRGYLDDYRIWNRVLTPAEAKEVFRQSRTFNQGLLNRIPLPLAFMEQAAGGTILPFFNHYQCSQEAD